MSRGGAPWRTQVVNHDGDQNQNQMSVPEFRNSYPEFAGFNRIVRGQIVTLNEEPRKRFHFLVNPSDISTSYRHAEGLRHSDDDFNLSEANLNFLGDGLMSISFNLMLDRTYEVHQGSAAYRGGVLHDVLALERLLGVPDRAYSQTLSGAGLDTTTRAGVEAASNWSAIQSQRSANLENVLNGVLVHKPVRALFGAADAFSFDGFVDSLSVHYTHFSSKMVPTRAGISISMSSIGNTGPGGGGMYNPIHSSPITPGVTSNPGGSGGEGSFSVFPN